MAATPAERRAALRRLGSVQARLEASRTPGGAHGEHGEEHGEHGDARAVFVAVRGEARGESEKRAGGTAEAEAEAEAEVEVEVEVEAALAGFGEDDVAAASTLAELSVTYGTLRSPVAGVRRGAARRAIALWRRQGVVVFPSLLSGDVISEDTNPNPTPTPKP